MPVFFRWVVFITILTGAAPLAHAQDYVPGEVIVKLRGEPGSEASYAFLGKAHSEKQMSLKTSWNRVNMFHFSLKPGQTVEQAVQLLHNDPAVLYAEPNYIVGKASNTGIIETYTYDDIQALAEQTGGTSTLSTDADYGNCGDYQPLNSNPGRPVVAVIDTGLDLNHSVFKNSGSVWTNPNEIPGNKVDDDGNGYIDDVNGWNFVDSSGSIYDDDGHGTHVSGIVLGVGQDIFGDTVAESKIDIMPLKFLDGNGVGATSDAIEAIYYAVNNGATVLNNSWGGPTYSAALHEAIAYSYENGVVFVAAAGNAGSDNDAQPMYPASYDVPHIISVAATNDVDYLASFSNYGASTVDLGSPGVFIMSTIPNNEFGSSSGTSMAAPFVAGVTALMKVESPNMLGYQARSIVFNEADGVSPLQNKVYTESRLNCANTVEYATIASVDPDQPSYNFSLGSENRDLASNLATGGCGMVTAFYQEYNGRDFGDGGGGNGAPGTETWYILIVLGLFLAPALIAGYLRSRQPANQRRHERFHISSDVTLKVGDKELIGNVSSISLGGVQVNTDALLEDGGIISMSITSPDGKDHVQVEGRVVWSEAQKAYGVAFANADDDTLEHISDWTKGLQKSG